MINDDLRSAAIANALGSINTDKSFPDNVFADTWDSFLFFESDALFDPAFIGLKDFLLAEGEASVIALVNLTDILASADASSSVFFFDHSTIAAKYNAKLVESSPSWLVLVDRYVRVSDKGKWCIYCEKQEDIAVIAFQESVPVATRFRVAEFLKRSSSPSPHESYGNVGDLFGFSKLLPVWRSQLIFQYSYPGPVQKP